MERETTIRALRWSDVPSLFRVASQAFLEDARYPIGSFADFSTQWRYVAESDGVVTGFLFGRERDGEKRGVQIALLAVHPAHQSSGVGTRLIARIERDARKAGHSTMRTGTPFALPFYLKQGFRQTETDFALTKELIGTVIPVPESDFVRACTFADLPAVIEDLGPRDRASFLDAFFPAYRNDPGRIFLSFSDTPDGRSRITGGAVGRANSRNRDLIEVVSLCGPEAHRVELLRHLEYRASTEGARWVGVRTKQERFARTLSKHGYEVAHLPEWWTLYYLEKTLSN